MDSGAIIYIILAIVFFILNSLIKKKGGNQKTGEEESSNEEEQSQKRQKSFEELLQEIRGDQKQREEDFEETGQKEVLEKREEDAIPEIEPYEIEDAEKEGKDREQPEVKYYEGTYQADQAEKEKKLVKLEDQVDLQADEKILGEVEDIAGEYSQSTRYKRLLRNPENLRESMVVSEILRRKHF